MKTLKKALPVAAALVWALLLLPFFLGAEAAHPATDDFTFAVYTHPTWVQTGSILHVLKDALSYTLRTWRDWQGTVTGVLIMTLNPAVFSLEHYGAHAVALLGLILLGTGVFLRHFLQKRLNLPWRAAFAALSAAQLLFLPDIVEGVYWFNGAWFYMGAQAVALMTLALGDSLSERLNSRKAIEPRRHTRLHARHLRLLQHDLGEPDDIRVVRSAPRKVAITQDPFRTNHRTKGVLNHGYAPYAALFLPVSARAGGVLGKRFAVGELGIDGRELAVSDDVAERNGIEVVAHQRLGSGPQGMIAARAHARTVTIGRGAIVHNHRALNGLDDLADSDVVRTDLETHATVDATQALHNTGLDQTVLNRAGKRIRDIDLFGSGANRKQTLRILSKHRQHSKGVISLPRYVHFSPFKEYEQLERAPGPSLCRDAK